MDLNKKIKKQDELIYELNHKLNNLLNEQSPPVDDTTGVSAEMGGAIEDLISLTKSLQDKDSPLPSSDKTYGGVLSLKHDEISFKDGNDSKISAKSSAGYTVSDEKKDGDKTIIEIKGSNNRLIPDDLILYITIPFIEGVNYRDDFMGELEQKNVKTGEEKDLDDVNMRIISYKN
jgi:hypothetical protein